MAVRCRAGSPLILHFISKEQVSHRHRRRDERLTRLSSDPRPGYDGVSYSVSPSKNNGQGHARATRGRAGDVCCIGHYASLMPSSGCLMHLCCDAARLATHASLGDHYIWPLRVEQQGVNTQPASQCALCYHSERNTH
ncbi:hypothetical protein O3P69_007943 [Scylla paramamosain]|uniref:Uncharacterized protein n=1 Tax=Scylla paramamosain TaxID=85552 RepID=A0AAW0T0E5_SCYPA